MKNGFVRQREKHTHVFWFYTEGQILWGSYGRLVLKKCLYVLLEVVLVLVDVWTQSINDLRWHVWWFSKIQFVLHHLLKHPADLSAPPSNSIFQEWDHKHFPVTHHKPTKNCFQMETEMEEGLHCCLVKTMILSFTAELLWVCQI